MVEACHRGLPTGQRWLSDVRASDLRPIRQHHNFRRRKVPDFHECRAVSVLHRNLLANRMRADVSASDSSLCGIRDHSQKRCHPAKRISGSGWRVQVHIYHHIAAPHFIAMAIYDAQSLLVIQNSRPCDKLTGRRQGERETKIRDRSLILPPVAQHGEALPHLNEGGNPDISRRGGIKAVRSGGAKGAEPRQRVVEPGAARGEAMPDLRGCCGPNMASRRKASLPPNFGKNTS